MIADPILHLQPGISDEIRFVVRDKDRTQRKGMCGNEFVERIPVTVSVGCSKWTV